MKRIYPVRKKKCYGTGGTVDDPTYSTIPAIGAAVGGTQGGAASQTQSTGMSSGQKAAIGTAAATGAVNTASVYSNPNSTTRQQTESINNTATGIVSAINPVVGTIIGVGNEIGKSVRDNAEQFDEQGNLKNKQKAKNTAIFGSFADPLQATTTRLSYKGGLTDLDGSKYAANLEKEQKKALGIEDPSTPITRLKDGGIVYDPTDLIYKDGGWIKGAVNPEHKGYCTPMTKSTCTPHRKAFAKRAKAHFKEEGGLVDSTVINAEKDELIINPKTKQVIKDLKPLPNHPEVGINPLGNTVAPVGSVVIPKKQRSRYLNSDPSHQQLMINSLQLKDSMKKMKYGGTVKKYKTGGPTYSEGNPNDPNPFLDEGLRYSNKSKGAIQLENSLNMSYPTTTPGTYTTEDKVTTTDKDKGYKMQPMDYLLPIGSAIASSAGAIDYLHRNKGPQDTRFQQTTSKYLDPSGAIKEINNDFAGIDYSLKNLGSANYLANRIESGARKADAVSKVIGEYANRNAEIENQTNQFNTQIKNNEIVANEQNKSAYEMARKAAIDNITGSMAGASKDILQYKRDVQRLGLVGDTVNYHYDQYGNEFYYKGNKPVYTGKTKT